MGPEDTSAPYSVNWNTSSVSNGSHFLTARARDGAGNSAVSAARTITVSNSVNDTTAPTIPTSLTATPVSSTQINLAWGASTDNVGVTGYWVFRGSTQIGTATTTSYSDAGLTASTSYTYTVRAVDASGNVSAASTPASATSADTAASLRSFKPPHPR